MRFSDYVLPGLSTFALGALCGVYFEGLFWVSIILVIAAMFLLLRTILGGYALLLYFVIGILCFGVGILRGEAMKDALLLPQIFKDNLNKYVEVEGMVSNNPERKGMRQSFELQSHGVRVLGALPHVPELSYGMKVRVFGRLRLPENFTSKEDKEVRYAALLRARGIVLLLDGKRAQVIERGVGNRVIALVYTLKRKILEQIETMSSPESGLLYGMVFGGKGGLTQDTISDFQIAGLLHIIVLSGQNLTIIAYIVVRTLNKFFGFYKGHVLAIITIIGYAVMGGLESATLRAVTMSTLLICALFFGRVGHPGRLLFATAVSLIALNPYILFDDPGFQLSVLAFAGILYVAPIVELWLLKRGFAENPAQYIAAIFGAQLAVLPYLLYATQAFTPYALIANALVLGVVGVVTLFGMCLSWGSLVVPSIFTALKPALFIFLHYIISIAHFIAGLPYAYLPIRLPLFVPILIYGGGVYWLWKRWRKEDLTPLAQFTYRNELKTIKKGNIPWVPDTPITIPIPIGQVDWSDKNEN